MRFIQRVLRYAIGNRANGNRRVYIQNYEDLVAANFTGTTRFNVEVLNEEIVLKPCIDGSKKVIEKNNGYLVVELDDKTITSFLGPDTRYVSVEFNLNCLRIKLHHSEVCRLERENTFVENVKRKVITTGALFAGFGALTYHFHQGLKEAGFKPLIRFANEIDDTAARLNLNFNPIWENATTDAVFIKDDIELMDMALLPSSVDHLEISLPCQGHSGLVDKKKRDINHPVTGKVFLRALQAIDRTNAATLTLECTKGLLGSNTFACITDFLDKQGYVFETTLLKGSQFGDFEHRERLCLFAVSKGLAHLFPSLERLHELQESNYRTFADIKESVDVDSPQWKTFEHVKKRDKMPENGYRNVLINDDDNLMPALVSTYSSPKAGAPFIPHPIDKNLQRQITPTEHARIRLLPKKLANAIIDLSKGKMKGQSRTNITAAHKLCGNSVSPTPWRKLATFMFSSLIPSQSTQLRML